MIFLGDDVFCYAKFFTVIHINSFWHEKYVFFNLKIWWNILFGPCKELGFWIFSIENFTVCLSIIVLCIPSVRAFPIQFLALKQINVGSQSEFMKKNCKTGFYGVKKKSEWKSHQYLCQKLWLLIGIVNKNS